MVVDTFNVLLDAIYTVLTDNSALEAAMGGTVRLSPDMAPPDTKMPYLVHRIEPRSDPFYPMGRGTYYLDIFSESPNSAELLAIRKLIMNLLDELQFTTTEASRARLTWFSDGPVPEEEQDIWHRAMIFEMWYFRDAEIDAINAR